MTSKKIAVIISICFFGFLLCASPVLAFKVGALFSATGRASFLGDPEKKTAEMIEGGSISYDKLVLGTGSSPVFPKWLPNDKKNVYTVPKIKGYLDSMQEKLEDAKKVIVVGAGFIGVELSDELTKSGIEVVLVEKLDHILSLAFDSDVAERAESLLKERGVEIKAGRGIKEILGNGYVEGVVLEGGEKVDADAVILSMGYSPNVQLAKDSGLAISDLGFIKVDEYMRTADPNVFAVGDCAEKRDFVTRKPSPIMLASTACAEARIAGMNLFKLSAIKTFSGTISIDIEL